jgi:hypothetical protein
MKSPTTILRRLIKMLTRRRKRSLAALRWVSLSIQLKLHGKTFLCDFYEASSAAGIRPFLMWGTLLGCVREGRFLPYDYDVDLGMLWSDYAKKDALVAAMQKRGYSLSMDKAYKLQFRRPFWGLRMDVDVFYPWSGKMISCWCIEEGHFHATSFHQNAFDRLREIIFLNDLKVLIPDLPTTVLTTIYGDWRTPVRNYRSGLDPLNLLQISQGEPMPRFPILAPDAETEVEKVPTLTKVLA